MKFILSGRGRSSSSFGSGLAPQHDSSASRSRKRQDSVLGFSVSDLSKEKTNARKKAGATSDTWRMALISVA